MDGFALALSAFILLHIGVSATGLRTRLVGAMGEGPYRGLFSLLSALFLVWMIWSFHAMRGDDFDTLNNSYWRPPEALRPLAYALIALGFLIGVAGILTPGPTLAGFESKLNDPDPARGMLRITRNPFLWGVALWGAGHMLVNRELFAPMLFGGLGLMSLFGSRSIDRKGAARNPEGWAKFAAATSNIPFAAIAQGRNKLVLSEIWWRLLAGAGAFALVGLFHLRLFGAAVFPVQF
jgi:uncharacterized membrane protein